MRGRRVGRSYEGEARWGMVKLAINTETETACDREQWTEEGKRTRGDAVAGGCMCTEIL